MKTSLVPKYSVPNNKREKYADIFQSAYLLNGNDAMKVDTDSEKLANLLWQAVRMRNLRPGVTKLRSARRGSALYIWKENAE